MSSPVLVTKLFIPAARLELVSRPHLIKQLNRGLHRKLTLISAPAGFGKTTLVTDWVQSHWLQSQGDDASSPFLVGWLSLDECDNDVVRFLTYLITALNRLPISETKIGSGVLQMIQSPQPPPSETILTALINEIALLSEKIILVLDDYHLIDSQPVHDALTFLLENLPPHLHLVVTTREDSPIPISRLRARGQLNELRALDLRFTLEEAAKFLNQVMGLKLSTADIVALESRTEGWIAGLQLAAISMQGLEDTAGFIHSFTGSNRMILDYLIEEVLNQQSNEIQTFLLQTAILDRFTGSLCNVVTGQENSRETLEMLERANLFIVHLDNERQWYRYHHLFADLLRQRLHQQHPNLATELHIRASQWHEDNDLNIDAFQHAVAANDVDRAARLVEDGQLPIHIHSVVAQIINWLESLPASVLNIRPSLLVKHARLLLAAGQTEGIDKKLDVAEKILQSSKLNNENRDLLGQIAANRATLASALHQFETILDQSKRALEYLHPANQDYRGSTSWKIGHAYLMQGYRAAAMKAYTEAVEITKSGNRFNQILAIMGLGATQEVETQLALANDSYQRALELFGDYPQPIASHAQIGLARICYEWNDLETALKHGEQSLILARKFGSNVDRAVVCELFLTQLKLTQGAMVEAIEMLERIEQSVQQHNFVLQIPKVAETKIQIYLHQRDLNTAAKLAAKHKLPISQARVHLAQGEISAALSILDPYRVEMEAKDWKDEILKIKVLQAVTLHTQGENDQAVQLLDETLALAEPGGFIRIFIDEGPPMARLLYEALSRGIVPDYVQKLLAAFPVEKAEQVERAQTQSHESEWIEPLSEREMEVLQLIADGLSRPEIAARLVLSLNTVKTHARNIYGKLGVKNQMLAVGKARAIGLLEDE
ncbi:MAG: NACHT domain-containing protein [Anaerolineaceae bacterium]|nr:NACHT domain-containing protein [Anaerolineaceae bacterium]